MSPLWNLHMELCHVTPRVWREVQVPSHLRLDDLHHVVQAVFGWSDFHPHVFEVGGVEFGPPVEQTPDPDADDPDDEDERRDEQSTTVLDAFRLGGEGITYVYDFVQDWRVRLARSEGASLANSDGIVCVGGEHDVPQREGRKAAPFTIEGANARLRAGLRPQATPERPAGPHGTPDQQLLARLTMAMLLLDSRRTRHGTREAWKHLRAEVLDHLHDAGLLEHETHRKAVTLTPAGVAFAERLLADFRR